MATRTTPQQIVLAGGGLAAQRCAETLRREGYAGAIRMVCAEPHAPYDRPPLSKQLLAGTCDEPSLALRPADWYAAHDVELLLGVRAADLRMAEHTLVLADGAELRYDRLLIATGARARQLPAPHRPQQRLGRCELIDDSRALRDALARAARVAVIGAGFIGQEVAATARQCGCAVTMVEAAATAAGGRRGDAGRRVVCPIAPGPGRRGPHRADAREGSLATVPSPAWSSPTVAGSLSITWLWVSASTRTRTGWRPRASRAAPGCPRTTAGAPRAQDVFAAGDVAASFDAASGRWMPGSHWEAAAARERAPPG